MRPRQSTPLQWMPAILLATGALVSTFSGAGPATPLRQPLADALPATWGRYEPQDVALSAEEQQVAGMTEYAFRTYSIDSLDKGTAPEWFSVYVGYYDRQVRGATIHSPKNCLPGSGWEPLETTERSVALDGGGRIKLNRYVLRQGDQSALVYYWYQGRGRTESDEYRVKFELLRDAALTRRTEEALVRIVVPLSDLETNADALAADVAAAVAARLDEVLPAWDG